MKWTPAFIIVFMLVLTVCINGTIMEIGVVFRSDHGDVSETRAILAQMFNLILGIVATGVSGAVGYKLGNRSQQNKG